MFAHFFKLRFIQMYPWRYSAILLAILINIPLSLILIVLVSYALKQFQSDVSLVSWYDLLGEHASRWIKPFVRDTMFEKGIPPEFQQHYFVYALLGLALSVTLFKFIQEYLLEDVGEKIACKLRILLIQNYLETSYTNASRSSEGKLSSLLGDEIRDIQQAFTRMMGSVLADFIQSFFFIGWLIVLDTQLFILFIMILLPCGLVIRKTGKTLKRLSKQGLQTQSDLLSSLLERFRGWQSIRVLFGLRKEETKFEEINDTLYHTWRRAIRARALSSPLVEWLAICAGALVLVLALRRIAEDSLSSNVLTSFLVTIGYLSSSVQSMTSQFNQSRKAVVSLNRVEESLGEWDKQTENLATTTSTTVCEAVSEINCRKLVPINQETKLPLFKSPISLQLNVGDRLGLIGPSGIGKSTFLRTLLGLEPPQSGTLRWNSFSLEGKQFGSGIPAKFKISFIPQEPFILPGSVAENVCYPEHVPTKGTPDEERLLKAMQDALLHRPLNQHVLGLSGGEKQRLMLARAFYRDASVWLVDEGSSALDEATEILILEKIREVSFNKIMIIVAHRQRFIDGCSKVLDLRDYV